MEILQKEACENDKTKRKKTFLDILIEVLDTSFNSSINTIEAKLQQILEEALKEYDTIPFLSIKDPSIFIDNNTKESFDESLMKDLKYILIHFKSDCIIHSERNQLILIMSKILNELLKVVNFGKKELHHIYVIITSALIGGREEHKDTIISFLIQFTEEYPKETLEIISNLFSEIIKEEKLKIIDDASLRLQYLLFALKNNDSKDLEKETDKYLNLIKTASKENIQRRVEESALFYRRNSLKNSKYDKEMFSYIPFEENDCKQNMFLLLRHYTTFGEEAFNFYEEDNTERAIEIKSILKQESFREKVYQALSSQTISQYYCIPNDNTDSTKSISSSQGNYIKNEKILEGYNYFQNKLKEKQYRDEFFDKHICVMRLAKNVKAFTNRYLNIVINYSGLEKIRNFQFNKEDINIEDFPNEDKEIVELINETLPRKVEEKETLIFLQILKSMLLLTIIHEFNHFVRRIKHINDDITKCVTDREQGFQKVEGGEHMFCEIFGLRYFRTITYEQAVHLYDMDNWGKADSLKKLKGEQYSKTSKCSLQCMEINEERGPCVERIIFK